MTHVPPTASYMGQPWFIRISDGTGWQSILTCTVGMGASLLLGYSF